MPSRCARKRLEHANRHVSNMIAAANNGTPAGASEVWTLSVAVDYLCDHLTEYLRAQLRREFP